MLLSRTARWRGPRAPLPRCTGRRRRAASPDQPSRRAVTAARRRRRSRNSPTENDARPAARYAGSGLAVFGAIAPFEKVVVLRGFPLGTCGDGAAAFAAVIVVSLALATCAVVPAAESTHVFMSVRLIRATLSARDFAAATVAGDESAAAFRGGATKVVN